MSRERFDQATSQQIAEAYMDGETATSLATRHACNRQTVLNAVRRHGGAPRSVGQPIRTLPPEALASLADRYRAGESQETIAVSIGCSQTVVSRYLRSLGVKNGRGLADGAQHPQWKGGRILVGGYVHRLVPLDHPHAAMRNTGGYVLEHRLVMAEALGRDLLDTETVHHIDGDRSNNAMSNLQLRQGRHGKGVVHRCLDCGSANIAAARLD